MKTEIVQNNPAVTKNLTLLYNNIFQTDYNRQFAKNHRRIDFWYFQESLIVQNNLPVR